MSSLGREDGGAKAEDVRVTATKAASKHGRLMSSARDGRVLSALMLPFFTVRLRIRGGTFAGIARELSEPAELEQARQALTETVDLFDYGECSIHLHGLPTRAKIRELHGYWFDTGVPLVIELQDWR